MKRVQYAIAGLLWLGVSGGAVAPALALKEAHPIATDNRIRTVVYNPNEVYRFIGHYGYQSSIEFSPREEILTVSLGDSIAWQVVPSDGRLFIKPIEPDAGTNMTVVTSERTYYFELDAREPSGVRDEKMIFVLRFVYPKNTDYVRPVNLDLLPPDPEGEPGQYNFQYTLSGPDFISPTKVFDDGTFTYFQFPRSNAELPAFFTVDSTNAEELVNYRVVGDYVVVERLAPRFTLRYGPEVVCVFNEQRYTSKERQSAKNAVEKDKKDSTFGSPQPSNGSPIQRTVRH